MVNTAHSHLSSATVVQGTPIMRSVNPASTYLPGDWCYLSAANTATYADKDTAASQLTKNGVLEFKPRMSSAWARKDCDDTFLATDAVPLILGGRMGPIIVIGKMTDPSGNVFPMTCHEPGGDDGAIKKAALRATGAASGFAVTSFPQLVWNADTFVSGDTYGKFLMY